MPRNDKEKDDETPMAPKPASSSGVAKSDYLVEWQRKYGLAESLLGRTQHRAGQCLRGWADDAKVTEADYVKAVQEAFPGWTPKKD